MQVSSRGGRRADWLRRGFHMKLYRDYFPITLHKTTDLDPNKNYIFGAHPHGIIGFSVTGNFGSEATGLGEKFPGIKFHVMTLIANFSHPLLRAYLLWMGKLDQRKLIKMILQLEI